MLASFETGRGRSADGLEAPVGRVGRPVVVRGGRRLLDLARHGHDVHVPDRGRRVVEGRPPGAPLHGDLAVPGDRDHRCVPVAGPAAVLPVLRGAAVPDVLHHRRVGLEAARLRRHEVPAVHDVRLGVPARRHPLPVRAGREPARAGRRSTSRALEQLAAVDRRRTVAVPRLLHRVRGEGAGVALAHVAARRAHRGADQGLDRAGGDPAEDGSLRHAAVQPRPVPRGLAVLRRRDHGARGRSASSTGRSWR